VHRFFDPELTAASTVLPQSEAQHAKVLRIRPGEEFEVTNGCGLSVTAVFDSDPEHYLQLKNRVIPKGYQIHLVQALAKNDRDELALQAATELGATEFTPWQSSRSVVQWAAPKADRNRERWQQIALGAMKQADRSWLPRVNPLATSVSELPAGGLLLAAGADQLGLADLPDQGCTLVVGPEGGLSQSEIDGLLSRGYRAVSVNDAVLRTSTAGPAAVAIIAHLKAGRAT
jgi:16S rRNA (uracil1498-N3)-methyltransferase